MAKLTEKYETMVVYSLKNGEGQVEGLNEKFSSLIETNATVVDIAKWGKRRLAYPINYELDGYYVLYKFDSKPEFPLELERLFNITEGILRFLTVLRNDAPVRPVPEAAASPEKSEEAPKPEEEPKSEEAAPKAEESETVSETTEE